MMISPLQFPIKKSENKKKLQKRSSDDLLAALSLKNLKFKIIRNDDLPAALSLKSSPHGEMFLHLSNNCMLKSLRKQDLRF